MEQGEEVMVCKEFIKSCDEGAVASTSEEYETLLETVRDVFQFASQNLRGLQSDAVQVDALCDTLFLWSKLRTFFTPNDAYSKIKGDEISIRKCDISVDVSREGARLSTGDQERAVYRGSKDYDASFVWGQLVGWYK